MQTKDKTYTLTTHIVAKRLGITKNYVRRLISEGILEAIDISLGEVPRYRISEEDYQKFKESRLVKDYSIDDY